MREHLQHYINGQWVDSEGGKRHEVINPATEEACTVITLGTAADVDKAVAAAREAFKTFSQTTPEERKELLDRIIAVYKSRMGDIAASISEEMGAPISFAQNAQAPAGLGHFIFTSRAMPDFPFEEEVAKCRVVHEPIGVVGMITPWNWPVNQITAKIAPCIAAGNTMILKPSEECPTNAVILAEIMEEAGVPAGVFNLVQGDGPGVGQAISSHPGIDMVSFTGSTRAGIAIATAAAATVKRVHQELGGKAPNIVLPDADFEAVLPPTINGVIANSGQSCIAPTRVLVPAARKAEAEAVITAIVEKTKVGDPAQEGGHIGPVVNKAQFTKIQGLIESAIEDGAKLLTGGPGLPEGVNRGFYIRPTVFTDVTSDMRIANEETFGPVVTIHSYDTLEDAVEIANDTPYGLSATISGDPAEAAKIAPKLRAGLVTVNSWSPNPGAPFGGYKQSGNGRENGRYGMVDFMEVKTIVGA